MRKTYVIAAIAAGITGAVTIFLYLSISLPLLLHTSPLLLYTWDASSALGYAAASQASIPTIVLVGQGSHLIVSLVWGFVYVVLLRVVAPVRALPIAWGIGFGAFVMLFMHYVIVPLGHAPQLPYTLQGFTNTLIAHTAFFGVPVAWVATKLTNEAARSYP